MPRAVNRISRNVGNLAGSHSTEFNLKSREPSRWSDYRIGLNARGSKENPVRGSPDLGCTMLLLCARTVIWQRHKALMLTGYKQWLRAPSSSLWMNKLLCSWVEKAGLYDIQVVQKTTLCVDDDRNAYHPLFVRLSVPPRIHFLTPRYRTTACSVPLYHAAFENMQEKK